MTTPTQPAIGINDVLATSFVNAKAPPVATLDNTALLLIDIQHLAEPVLPCEKRGRGRAAGSGSPGSSQ